MPKSETPDIIEKQELQSLAAKFRSFMEGLGLDLEDSSLKETPMRVAKMFRYELFGGLINEAPKLSTFPNTRGYDQMIVIDNIELASTCEHHFLPFIGKCHIAYFPGDVVVGLSKFNRIVRHFAARPQIQEKLVHDISAFFRDALQTEDVAVIIKAEHLCAKVRGVKDSCSATTTMALHGRFRESQGVRTELFQALALRP